VLLAAGGAAVGWHWADPVIGLAITLAILAVLRDAAREVYRRLMDSVDPATEDEVESVLRTTPGVLMVGTVQLRWIGHRLRADCEIVLNPDLTVAAGHAIAVDAEHRLMHAIPRLARAFVHADPHSPGEDPHAALEHHWGSAVAGT
jgi:cation diffusion facilitator family transporter